MNKSNVMQVAVADVYGDVEENADAAEYGGYVAQVVDGVYEKVKPRWSVLQREKLAQAGQPADDQTLRRLLRGFPADWANTFARHNKLIALDRGVGHFAPRLPIVGDAGENYGELEREAYDRAHAYRLESEKKQQAKERNASPVYYLHQIFSDASVAEKLLLDPGVIIVASRLAVSNPGSACEFIVRHAKECGLKIVVRVGNYAKSRKASRQTILSAAEGLSAIPYDVQVVGDNVLVRGTSSHGDVESWTVKAQHWQMPELDAIYRLTISKGVTTINALLTEHMARVGVDLIPDGDDYGFDMQNHVGVYDDSISGNRVSMYGGETVRSSRGVFPVMFDGKVMGSAVYAGNNQFYVCWHVVSSLHSRDDEDDSFVALRLDSTGDDLHRLSMVSEVANDVWLAELEVGAEVHLVDLAAPMCREARSGEQVVAVYAVPTGVECTDSVSVETYDLGRVCMPRFPQARSGMSGAALISVEDGSLLGLYTGSNRMYSLGVAVHVQNRGDWLNDSLMPLAAPKAYVPGKGADAVYKDLKARGLGQAIAEVSGAVKLLHSGGRHVGSEYLHQRGSVTVVDPSAWSVVDVEGDGLDFQCVYDGGVRSLAVKDVAGPAGRRPELNERVFSIYRDDKGVIFSDLLQVVWLSPDGKRCRLDGVPKFEGKVLRGSVLVSLSDCSPLGLVSRVDEAEWGMFSECVTWSHFFDVGLSGGYLSAKNGLFDKLSARFTRLKTSTWSDDDVRALTVGDVPAVGAYTRVGSSATLATVLGKFSQLDLRGVERIVATRFDDDVWLSDLCGVLLPGFGAIFGSSNADRSATLKVFLGLVFLREGLDGLNFVLDEIGLFDIDSYSTSSAVEVLPRPRSI